MLADADGALTCPDRVAARVLTLAGRVLTLLTARCQVLEPLGAMSDGFNNHDGLHIISPGETFTGTYTVSLE